LTPAWLQTYVDRGFRLVFYDTKTKGPRNNDWNTTIYNAADYREGQNVGTVTGHEVKPGKYLVDIDFDYVEGIPMAKRLLPETKFGFGRASCFLSHAFYTIPAPVPSQVFKGIDGKNIVEFRCTKKDGTLGWQTMLPPSIHPEGEVIQLRIEGDPGHSENLLRWTALYSIACLLHQHLGHRGFLHETRLAMAGFLLSVNLTEEEVVSVGEALAMATGNNVADVAVTVRTTVARLKAGEKVAGSGVLAKIIGESGPKVVARIREWLGENEFITRKGDVIDPNHQENISRAIAKLGIQLSYDEFAEQMCMGTDKGIKRLDDNSIVNMWLRVDREFGFRPSKEFFYDVVSDICRDNPFHPVRTYLDGLKWDGTPRIDEWLIRIAGAGDTPFCRAVSRIFLMAAVRRVRQPGVKFDEMLILESEQGLQKSTALALLAVNADWFSDDFPLDIDAKEMIERTTGRWIIEAAELDGMRPSGMEHLKASLSRSVDGPVRKAYGRETTTKPRQHVPVGTTNKHSYLSDITGNRRFWPVRIVKFDLDLIRAERDQLWAEAAHREAAGESIRLPEELYELAGKQQERRRSEDPWESRIYTAFNLDEVKGEVRCRVSPDEIWTALGVPMERRDHRGQRRIIDIMQRLGFRRMTIKDKVSNKNVKGWAKGPGERDPYSLLEHAHQTPGDEHD
jgi:hypothetical protein